MDIYSTTPINNSIACPIETTDQELHIHAAVGTFRLTDTENSEIIETFEQGKWFIQIYFTFEVQ